MLAIIYVYVKVNVGSPRANNCALPPGRNYSEPGEFMGQEALTMPMSVGYTPPTGGDGILITLEAGELG